MAKSTGYVFKGRRYIGSAEPPATVLEDESRFGNDFTFAGDGSPNWVQLPSGLWVMDFDGADDYAIKVDPSFAKDQQGSVEMWVYRVSADARVLLGFTKLSTGTVDEWTIQAQAGEEAALISYVGGSGAYYGLSTTDAFPVNTWLHLCVTSDGTTLKLYVNAVLLTLSLIFGANSGQWFGDFTAANQITIGALARSNDYIVDLEGKIAPPGIRNYPLSAGKVKQIFEAERHLFGI